MCNLLTLAGPIATIIAAAVAVYVTWWLGNGQIRIAEEQKNIARQQAELADVRLRHDLYDRRFKIYAAARTFIVETERNARISDDALFSYVRDTLDAVFLFDQKVVDYLEVMRKRAFDLRMARVHVDQQQEVGPERARAVDAEMRVLEWFQGQFEVLIVTFRPFLTLEIHPGSSSQPGGNL